MLIGTDISHYQSAIPAGSFCVLKATEGLTYVDPDFAGWWRDLAASGTLRGAYHFFHPGLDPVEQADHFLATVLAQGLRPGDTLWLDHEALSLASPRRTVLPPSERLGMEAAFSAADSRASAARRFCDRVISKAGRCGVYTFLSFTQAGHCAGLGDLPLWMADPSRPAGQPRVPAPWTHAVMHQYAETSGVDRDAFLGDQAAWLALGASTHSTPTSTEDDVPNGLLSDGAQAITPISLPKGRYKTIGFIADNGLQGLPPAQLRVAIHQGGGSWHLEQVTVDSHKGQTVVHFPDVANTDGISVRREDAGTVHIAYEVS